jgi:hypothetical protein
MLLFSTVSQGRNLHEPSLPLPPGTLRQVVWEAPRAEVAVVPLFRDQVMKGAPNEALAHVTSPIIDVNLAMFAA